MNLTRDNFEISRSDAAELCGVLATAIEEGDFLARELVDVREHVVAIGEADRVRIADLLMIIDTLRGIDSRKAA